MAPCPISRTFIRSIRFANRRTGEGPRERADGGHIHLDEGRTFDDERRKANLFATIGPDDPGWLQLQDILRAIEEG